MNKRQQAADALLTATPLGEAVGVGCGALWLAGVAQACLLMLGVGAWTAWYGHFDWPATQKIVALSTLPWAVAFLGILSRAWAFITPRIEVATNTDIDGDGYIGPPALEGRVLGYQAAAREDVRVVPAYNMRLIDGLVHPGDLRHFVKVITTTRDWTQKTWVGKPLPSGVTADYEYLRAMIEQLLKIHAIIDYGPRKTGRLMIADADEIIGKLERYNILPKPELN